MTSMDDMAYPSAGSPTGISKTAAASYQNDHGEEEGITVAIRMRPLNNIEGDKRRVWKVLPKYSSVAQTTTAGKPLPERVIGRNFFTFDKTFGEDANTARVYSDVAKGIVSSVVNGLNGTIFAYGQTSSGKTYTMQGSGTIQSGSSSNDDGGVVHMAARDIFSQIKEQAEDRIFLVRASFLEIYNEEVKDLLSPSNQTLPIREDPKRGVFVQSVEEIVTDFESLLRILFQGEKSRAFAATAMNERSSRSHTIFRITIESRQKGSGSGNDSDNDDFMYDSDKENSNPSGDGAVRISTLNLVDLAGSESVRHTGATGERKKEGAMINQSLLTLSRVMVALGSPNSTHVNFRDSKLTRILQPSLSGNARMAVICCATPSELYLEETRSTLQFASRAKLVKTNAKINEVLDDRSMIRKLQRELAEARRGSTVAPTAHLKALETKAATADSAAMEAKAKLDRLKLSILNGGHLFGLHEHQESTETSNGDVNMVDSKLNLKKRRRSDGFLSLERRTPAKKMESVASPSTLPRPIKKTNLHRGVLSPSSELSLVREAVSHRSELVAQLKSSLAKHVQVIDSKDSEIVEKLSENEALALSRDMEQEKSRKLEETVTLLRAELEGVIETYEKTLSEKDLEVHDALSSIEKELHEKKQLRGTIEDLEKDMRVVWEEAKTKETQHEQANAELLLQIQLLTEERDKTTRNVESKSRELEQQRDFFVGEATKLQSELSSVQKENSNLNEQVSMLETDLKSKESDIKEFKMSLKDAEQRLTGKAIHGELQTRVLNKVESKLHIRDKDVEALSKIRTDEISSLQASLKERDEVINIITQQKEQAEHSLALSRAKNETRKVSLQNSEKESIDLRSSVASLHQRCAGLSGDLVTLRNENSEMISEKQSLENLLETRTIDFESRLRSAQNEVSAVQLQFNTKLSALQSEKTELHTIYDLQKEQLESTISQLESEKNDVEAHLSEAKIDISNRANRIGELENDLLHAKRQIESDKIEITTIRSQKAISSTMMGQLGIEKTEVERRLQEATKEVQSLKTVLDLANQHILQLQTEQDTLQNQQIAIKTQATSIAKERDEMSAKVQGLNGAMHISAEENMKLLSDVNSLRLEIVQLEEAKTQIESKLQSAETQIMSHRADIEMIILAAKTSEESKIALEHTLSQMEEDSEILRIDNESMSDALMTSKSNVDALEAQLTTLKSEATAMEARLSEVVLNTERITTENCALSDEIKRILSEKDAAESRAREVAGMLDIAVSAGVESSEKVAKVLEKNEDLEERVASLEQELASVKHLHTELHNEKRALEASIESLNTAKTEIEENHIRSSSTFQSERQMLQDKISELERHYATAESKLEAAAKDIEALKLEKETLEENAKHGDALKSRIAMLERDLTNAKQDQDSTKRDSDAAREAKSLLEKQLQDLEAANFEVQSKLLEESENWRTSKQSLEDQLNELESVNTTLKGQVGSAKEKIQKLRSEKEDLLAESEEEVGGLRRAIQEADDELVKLRDEHQNMESLMESLKNDIKTARDEASSKAGEIHCLQEEMKELVQSKRDMEELLKDSKERATRLAADKETLLAGMENSTSTLQKQLDEARTEVDSLKSSRRGLESKISELEVATATVREELSLSVQMESTLREANKSLGAQLQILEASKIDAENRLRDQTEIWQTEKQESCDRLQQADKSIQIFRGQLDKANTELIAVKAALATSNDTLEKLEATSTDINEKYDTIVHEASLLKEEKNSVETQLRESESSKLQTEERLKEELERRQSDQQALSDSQSKVSELETTCASIKDQYAAASQEAGQLKATIDSLKEQVQNLEETTSVSHSEFQKQTAKWDSDRKEFETKVEDLYRSNTALLVQLRAAEEEIQKVQIQRPPSITSDEVASQLKQINDENTELKRLLAEANESVQEARDAALTADDELKSREKELEDAVYRLSQLEDELRDYDSSNNNSSANEQSHHELQIELNAAKTALQELESTLNQERSDRKSSEEQLRRQIGEEQRVLLNEGQKRMEALKAETENLKKSLEQSEKEAYAARQEIEEQRDKVSDANGHIQKFEDQISKLRAVLQQKEGQVASYMSDLNKVRSENSTLKRSAQESNAKFQKASSDLDFTNRELAKVRANLQEKESEVCNFAQELQKLRSLASDHEFISKQVEKLRIENEEVRKEIQSKETKLEKLVTEKHLLEGEVEKLKGSNVSQPGAYNLRNASDPDRLLKKIEVLTKTVKDKDEQVKKYKSRCMTNSQINHLKKIKAERQQYMEDLKEARKKIAEMEQKEVATGGTGATASPSEFAELHFEKNALETKLRKVAQHCQRLEGEKREIVNVINTSDKKRSYNSEEVTQAVTDICDKLSSLEEEYDTLSKGGHIPEGRSNTTTLQRENASLESMLDSSRSKVAKMEKNIADLSKKVSECQQKLTLVSHERDELQKQINAGRETDATEKVRELEAENLQLHNNLKTKARQLKNARAELEDLRMKQSSENPTLNFETKDFAPLKSQQIRDSGKSIDQSTPMSKDSRSSLKSKMGSFFPGSSKKKSKIDVTSTDKENVSSNMDSLRVPAAKKRPNGNNILSGKKSKRPRETPGLGEAAPAGGDETSECKQS